MNNTVLNNTVSIFESETTITKARELQNFKKRLISIQFQKSFYRVSLEYRDNSIIEA